MAKKKSAEKPSDDEDLNDEAALDEESAEVIPVVDVPPAPEVLLPTRDWRDVERLREIRDLKKLVDEDLDFDSLFPPKPLPTVKPLKPAKAAKTPKLPKAAKVLAAAPAVTTTAKPAATAKPVKEKSPAKTLAAKPAAAKAPAKKAPKKSGGLLKVLKKALKPKKPAAKKKKR